MPPKWQRVHLTGIFCGGRPSGHSDPRYCMLYLSVSNRRNGKQNGPHENAPARFNSLTSTEDVCPTRPLFVSSLRLPVLSRVMLGAINGMKPGDEAEAMNIPQQDAAVNGLKKLTRTYAAQIGRTETKSDRWGTGISAPCGEA